MREGFGQTPFGRGEAGNARSSIEPRFDESIPADGSSGWGTYRTTVRSEVYCFSSRIQDDNFFKIEVSENAGLNFSVAYENSFFVSPYNGANSRIDFQQAYPQKCIIYLEKISFWPRETEIHIRVTARDGFGDESTKEIPVKWD